MRHPRPITLVISALIISATLLASQSTALPAEEPKLEKMHSRADEMIRAMDSQHKSLAGLVEESLRNGDVIEINCLTSKLAQVRTLRSLAEQRNSALQDAIYAGDAERAHHAYRVLSVANAKSSQLLEESVQCLGKLSDEISIVETDITTDLLTPEVSATEVTEVDVSLLAPPSPPDPAIAGPMDSAAPSAVVPETGIQAAMPPWVKSR